MPTRSYPTPCRRLDPTPSSTQMSSSTFKFSGQAMTPLILEACELCPDATPFDILAALLWTRIARFKTRGNSCNHKFAKIAIDMRRVMREKLPFGFFSNAVLFSLIEAPCGNENDHELWQIAKLVNGGVLGIQEGEIQSASEQFGLRREDGGVRFVSSVEMYSPEVTILNMKHMAGDASAGGGQLWEMYEAKLVDGKRPIHVSISVGNTKGEGLIVVVPEEGLGQAVTVVLLEEAAARLHEDEEVLKLEPTVILSVGHNYPRF